MELVILVVVMFACLLLVPLGLPGLWLMAGAALLYTYVAPEGGSSRAAWGAIAGGIVGAVVGFPLPVIGPMIGGFIGSFLGALVAEYLQGSELRSAGRVATGALVGRLAATALKIGFGMMIIAWVVGTALLAAWLKP